jgi:DNA-binding response OmpR family regulator
LLLDPAKRETTVSGAPIELTAKEFAMLEYLVRHQDRTVSKGELLEHVWSDPETAGNAVEVYAGYLRRKLGRDAIVTVRGAGYRLNPL